MNAFMQKEEETVIICLALKLILQPTVLYVHQRDEITFMAMNSSEEEENIES